MKKPSKISFKIPLYFYYPAEEGWENYLQYFAGDYDIKDDDFSGFVEILEEVVQDYYQATIKKYDSLLQKNTIHSILLTIPSDYFLPFMGSIYKISEGDDIDIQVGLRQETVNALLEKRFYPNARHCDKIMLSLDHELIHGMDSKLYTYYRKYAQPNQPKEHILNFLLGFRAEGVANLVSFLRGMGGEKSLLKSKQLFLEFIRYINKCFASDPNDWKTVEDFLDEEKFTANSLGPLMILHCLWTNLQADSPHRALVQKAINIEFLSDEEINTLIGLGLEVDFDEFLYSLTAPGMDGHPFIDADSMLTLFIAMRDWQISLPEGESLHQYDMVQYKEFLASMDEMNMTIEEDKRIHDEFYSQHLRACINQSMCRKQWRDLVNNYLLKIASEIQQDQISYLISNL